MTALWNIVSPSLVLKMHSRCRHRTLWARTLWNRALSNSCFGCSRSSNAYALIDGSQDNLLLEEKVPLVDSTTTSYRSFPPSNLPTITQSANCQSSPPVDALSSSATPVRPSSVNSTSHRNFLDVCYSISETSTPWLTNTLISSVPVASENLWEAATISVMITNAGSTCIKHKNLNLSVSAT